MLADFNFIIFWWLSIFVLSVLAWPLVFLLFKKFYDLGYAFTKIVSLTFLTYLIFVLGVVKVLPFTVQSIFLLILFLVIFNCLYLFKNKNYLRLLKTLKQKYKIIIFEEILFLLVLIGWSFVRGFAPNIEGLEKFMDWGFINSALRSFYLPPQDMWFAGEPINYYYFGHLIFALLTKISSIPSTITYNLSIATVAALTFVSTFSLASNLIYIFLAKSKDFKAVIIGGLISALLLTFGGNLHAVYKIARINIQNEGHLTLTKNAINQAVIKYWYPDATRFIGHDPETKDKTIHEFPGYSFVVADLHGHMNDIPIVIFFMAYLFVITFKKKKYLNWNLIIPAGFILSIAYMTNAWDFAVYGLLLAIFIFFVNIRHQDWVTSFNQTFFNGLLTIAFWYLFSLPFSLNFTPMAEGLRLSDARSPFYQLFILHGGFWLIGLPYLVYLIFNLIKKTIKFKNIKIPDLFVLALIITATLLVIIPEIGYIKDIYIYEHRRANTMFKLVYEAFIMYSLVSGYILVRLVKSLKSTPLIVAYKILFFIILTSHLIYPYFAVKSYYGLTKYKGLWGLQFLQEAYPDNLKAIEWINKNISGQPVMLEAVGDSYTTYNHVSMATGLPTVEGWIVHEWLWRGGFEQPSARQADVQKIYESEDLQETQELIKKYNIEYIFVGDKEYEKYPTLNEEKFVKLDSEIIFQSGKTKIYKI